MIWQGDEARNVFQVRDHNRALVLRCLSRRGGLSRSEIAERIGLTEAGISRIVRELIDEGLLCERETAQVSRRPGRRHIALNIVPDAAYVASVCLTVFDHSLRLVDLLGKCLVRLEFPEIFSVPGKALPAMVAAKLREAAKKVGIQTDQILGVAITTVGSVDRVPGKVNASSIAELNGRELVEPLQRLLGLPVMLATVGEAINIGENVILEKRVANEDGRGAEQELHRGTALLVHVAFGMGANILVDGRSHGNEQDERLFAHVPLPGRKELCMCGGRGCLLTRASGHAILRRLKSVDQINDSGKLNDFDAQELLDVIGLAENTKSAAGKLLYEAGYALGNAMFAVTACLPPERIILAGVVGQAMNYAAGVAEGVQFAWARIGKKTPKLVVSKLDYGSATDLFAVDQFLLAHVIDARKLVRR